jgi:hypothetical protein
MPRKRRELLSHLDEVLEVAFSKYGNPRTKNQERQGWGRLIVNAVEAASSVLRDSDLDDLLRRIEKLEEARP